MREKTYLTGKCPKCMEELRVPEGLKEFSCMFCGQRLTAQELLSEEEAALASVASQEDRAAYDQVLPQLVTCVTGYAGYNKKITREAFLPAFEQYEADNAPLFQTLDRAIQADEAHRKALTKDAALRLLDDLEQDWAADKQAKSKMGAMGRMEDDKIIIAIFLVPMVRKQGLSCGEAFCQVLQAEWVRRHPKSPFYLGDYDSIAGGFRKKFLGLCFITTAVCEQQGLPDDCEQLTAFRGFRDGYLRSCDDGQALIQEYYNIAPGIVSCINVCEDREQAYAQIRKDYLDDCYAFIQEGRNAECKALYTRMVRELEKKYLS